MLVRNLADNFANCLLGVVVAAATLVLVPGSRMPALLRPVLAV